MKKTLAMLLALLTLLALLAACVETPNPENGDETTGGEATTEQDAPLDAIPEDLKFNGEDVVILNRGGMMFARDEVAVPELNSEPVNDAIFNRNIVVGDRLNVNVVSHSIEDSDAARTLEEMERVVKAGGDDYDMFACACYATMPASLGGLFYDLQDMEYLDLSQSYWMPGYNEAASYRDRQYTATGAIALSTYRLTLVTLFNKEMFDDRSLPYLYEAVENDEWTLDFHSTLVENFYQDLNGDAKRDEKDLYGHVSSAGLNLNAYWAACDVPMVGRDAEGAYTWVVDTEKLSNVMDKLLILFHESGGSYICKENEENTAQPEIREMFSKGRAATTTLRLLAVELDEIRSMEQEYGIVPIPKYDQTQKEYATMMQDQFTVFAIPASVKEDKLELAAATMEVMASESLRMVRPAYYEIAIKRKYMSDPVAWDMLDLTFANVKVDPGMVFGEALGYPHHKLYTMVKEKRNSVASEFGKIRTQMNKQLAKFIKKMEQMEE